MKSLVKEGLARGISLSIALGVVCVALDASGVENHPAMPVGFSSFASAPLYFERNAGQFEGDAQFIARGSGCSVLLAPTQAEIMLGKPAGQIAVRDESVTRSVRLQLVGANPASKIAGLDELPARANYFIGNEPSKWHTGVPMFSRVQVDEVYPGVKVVYYANQSAQLEYDFLLQPGAQPAQIHFRVSGADNVRVDAAGNLALKIGADEIQQHKPVAYQEINGARKEIPASYHLNTDGTVGFALAAYDHRLPLVIDPVLDFLTYIGGKKLDIGWAIALDNAGNIYAAGESLSTDLLTTNTFTINVTNHGVPGITNFDKFRGGNNSFGDAFVAKYDNSGVLQFLTYLGGKTDDGALGIAFDNSGNPGVWITGFTDSTNFPLQNPNRPKITGKNNNAKRIFSTDAFITKLDPSGATLLYSTYYGGDRVDEGVGLTVDAAGSVYVTGLTDSTNLLGSANVFQSTNRGNFDAFVTKLIFTGLNPGNNTDTYTNAYSTYFGGTNVDYGLSIAVDSGLNAWVTGFTFSTNLFTTNALQLAPGVDAYFPDGHTFTNLNTETIVKHKNNALNSDAFVAEFSPDGTIVPFATYLGGTNDDVGEHIVIDNAGHVYVAGYTLAQDFPTNVITVSANTDYPGNELVFPNVATNFLSHAFVTEIVNGALGASTHFGGNLADQAFGVAVDGNGLIYVTGSAASTNFFATNMVVVTNGFTCVSVVKHGETNLVCTPNGFFTNNPIFTSLSNTNITVKLKQKGNTNDVFVVVLSQGLTNFVHGILLGGPGQDDANGIAVDPSGNAVYLVGSTTSTTNFSTTNAAQPISGGKKNSRLTDAFVSKIQIVPSP